MLATIRERPRARTGITRARTARSAVGLGGWARNRRGNALEATSSGLSPKASFAPLFSMASAHESHDMLPPLLWDAASLGDTTSKVFGIAQDSGAVAVYPLISMVRFDLLSAQLSFGQSRRGG